MADTVSLTPILAQASDEEEKPQGKNRKKKPKKDPWGVAGGKKRAQKLTPEERSAIARKAAKTRWAKEKPQNPPE